jgi:hypothetical protein
MTTWTGLESGVADRGDNWHLGSLEIKDLHHREDNNHCDQEGDDGLQDRVQIEFRDTGGPDGGDPWEHTLSNKHARKVEGGLCQEETDTNTSDVLLEDEIFKRKHKFVVKNETHW